MAIKNPALGEDGVDYSNESYKQRVAKWRRDVLYAAPPVDHLEPIPQFPLQHKPAPFHKPRKKSSPVPPPKPRPPANLFEPS